MEDYLDDRGEASGDVHPSVVAGTAGVGVATGPDSDAPGSSQAVMVALYPDLDPTAFVNDASLNFVFVVDRSGSMGGWKMSTSWGWGCVAMLCCCEDDVWFAVVVPLRDGCRCMSAAAGEVYDVGGVGAFVCLYQRLLSEHCSCVFAACLKAPCSKSCRSEAGVCGAVVWIAVWGRIGTCR